MITRNQEETIELGINFAKKLHGGEVLALIGDLGSGKTTFMKGLAEGLKVVDVVNSPTFVLLKPYPAQIISNYQKINIELIHVDAYRVELIEDIKSVGIEDYLNRDDIILAIEWAEKIREILPKETIEIKFKTLDKNNREISI